MVVVTKAVLAGLAGSTVLLVVGGAGRSAVSAENLAVAPLDEIEQPAHRGRRFTVGS